MPRNACTECRVRKVRCIYPEVGGKCERCISRMLQCSNSSNLSDRPQRSTRAARRSSTRPRMQLPVVQAREPIHEERRSERWRNFEYDIGDGSPAEVIRETDLVRESIIEYFSNYSDIHYLFDQQCLLRDFDLGEIPKLVLYAIMALSVRYSNAQAFSKVPRCHRGEPFFREARRLFEKEFDNFSLTTVQIYILFSTYQLTLGGAGKAWMLLGMASSIAKGLRLSEIPPNGNPLKAEMCRRVFSTILLMDRTLSPSLNMSCYYSPTQKYPGPCPDLKFARLKSGTGSAEGDESSSTNTISELLSIAQIFCQVCLFHRRGGQPDEWEKLELRQVEWRRNLSVHLVWSPTNLPYHQARGSVRQFIYVNLLYHHVGQLIYFPFLQAGDSTSSLSRSRIDSCYYHATAITNILDYAWGKLAVDIHNVSLGQILTMAAAVHMHASLTAVSSSSIQASRKAIQSIKAFVSRVKEHCRIFNRISFQLDTFLQICNDSATLNRVFDRNERLVRHVLHYGTTFERQSPNNEQITILAEADPPNRDVTPGVPNPESITSLSTYSEFQQPGIQSPDEPLSLDFQVSSGQENWPIGSNDTDTYEFENYAWIYSDESLNDLYSISFLDSTTMFDPSYFVN